MLQQRWRTDRTPSCLTGLVTLADSLVVGSIFFGNYWRLHDFGWTSAHPQGVGKLSLFHDKIDSSIFAVANAWLACWTLRYLSIRPQDTIFR
jgi:hypothetical protein